MKIGELAKATSTAVETIRFYEREGILSSPMRSQANYRVYEQVHVDRLAFVRHCRSLDMTLDEIRVLLRFKDAPGEDCGEINALLDKHIDHVVLRVRELRTLEKNLKALRCMCKERHAVKDCGILQELTQAARTPSDRPRRVVGHVHGTHR